MRSSSKWFKVMTMIATGGTMMASGCAVGWPWVAGAFTAGFFGVLGAEALLAPQILLGLGAYLPFVNGQ